MPQKLETLVHYQTGLFTALVGVLAAKGIVTRQEIAAALDIVARQESDPIGGRLLGLLSECLLTDRTATEELARFQVILGGLHDGPD